MRASSDSAAEAAVGVLLVSHQSVLMKANVVVFCTLLEQAVKGILLVSPCRGGGGETAVAYLLLLVIFV